jgi:hypothetical protein
MAFEVVFSDPHAPPLRRPTNAHERWKADAVWFLRAYIPARFDVSTGFVFDSKGNVSKQLDIVIANALVCPRFETAGGNRFYP